MRKRKVIVVLISLFLFAQIYSVSSMAASGGKKESSIEYSLNTYKSGMLHIYSKNNGRNKYILKIQGENITAENVTDVFWIGRNPYNVTDVLYDLNYTRIPLYDVAYYPGDNHTYYVTILNISEVNETNRTFNFIIMKVNYTATIDKWNATPANVSIVYVHNISCHAFLPTVSYLDTTILDNGTMIIVFDITNLYYDAAYDTFLKNTTVYIYKILNLSQPNWTYVGGDGPFQGFLTGLHVTSTGNLTMVLYGKSNYIFGANIWTRYYLVYMEDNLSYSTQLPWGINPKQIGNLIFMPNNDVLGCVLLEDTYKQEEQLVLVKISGSFGSRQIYVGEPIITDTILEGFLGYKPEFKCPRIAWLNETDQIWYFSILYSDTEQYIMTMRIRYDDMPNFNWDRDVIELYLYPVTNPTKLHVIDNFNYDHVTNLVFLESGEGVIKVAHMLVLYIKSDNCTYLLYPYYISRNIESIFDYSIACNPTFDMVMFMTIKKYYRKYFYVGIAYFDEDRDGLGSWEEKYVYNLNATDPDWDKDGINDGGEVLMYDTDPFNNDTDHDDLDDKFEIEKKPNETYPKYGNITNLYQTDPLDSDTDDDGLSDYQEVTGDYIVGSRQGYRTDPTTTDTDGDGINDYDEIYNGVLYWINSTTYVYISYPNATKNDTDGDGILDGDEKARELDPTNNDTDNDGLNDSIEVFYYRTEPHKTDSDSDGLSDGDEVLTYNTDPWDSDTDDDLLNDSAEVLIYSTDPHNPDWDNDRLLDGEEISYGTDPYDNDTDDDGIIDGIEVKAYGTDPASDDTDNDGLTDYEEIYGKNITTLNKTVKTDPLDNDTDDDGLSDGDEASRYGTDPLSKDTDNDGLTDYEEVVDYSTDPLDQDTDNDGLTDYEEVVDYSTDPNDPDTDKEGLTDYEEVLIYNTDPNDSDTDGDSLSDFDEVNGTNVPGVGWVRTDPTDPDTDGDGLSDDEEVNGVNIPGLPGKYYSNPAEKDSDGDRLTDFDEVYSSYTDPLDNDTDDDGLLDGREHWEYGTDPLDNDSDDDLLSDYVEVNGVNITGIGIVKTDPLNNDTDDDQIIDGVEAIKYKTNPLDPDTDDDSLTDYEEVVGWNVNVTYFNGTTLLYSTNSSPIKYDTDGDGLDDYSEYLYGSDPWNNDTDMDGLSDFDEDYHGTDMLDADSDDDMLSDCEEVSGINVTGIGIVYPDPWMNDTDDDGINDYNETKKYYTDPTKWDTDGDGLGDYEEVLIYETNPKDVDSDNDMLDDWDEVLIYETNATCNDTDRDGLVDGEEVYGVNITGVGVRYTDPHDSDTDGDELTDYEEAKIYHTDPTDIDTDGDGLDDGQEIMIYSTNATLVDTDFDNVDDYKECVLYGTNPRDPDSDDDGLTDGDEINGIDIPGIGVRKTNATSIDTDGDGLSDYDEAKGYHTDPTYGDTDDDGLSDYEEVIVYGTNPTDGDTDDDGLSDYEEVIVYGTDAANNDTDRDCISDGDEVSGLNITGIGLRKTDPLSNDTDGDGLSDPDEVYEYTTDPTKRDTDEDGLDDGLEVEIGGDPKNIDTDGDGLTDGEEYILYGTRIDKKDTDGDGLSDYVEVKVKKTDPTKKDTDGDYIIDSLDLIFPLMPDWYLMIVIIIAILFYKSISYGMFRNWRKDIIAFGLSDVGGVPMFVLPEDFQTKYDPSLISSGLMGIHTMTGEISGKEVKRLVLSGEVPIFVNRGETSIAWAFIKKDYPRLIKQLSKIHEELEKNYGPLLTAWTGLADEIEDIRIWIANRLGISPRMEVIEEEVEEKGEIEKEFEEVFGK